MVPPSQKTEKEIMLPFPSDPCPADTQKMKICVIYQATVPAGAPKSKTLRSYVQQTLCFFLFMFIKAWIKAGAKIIVVIKAEGRNTWPRLQNTSSCPQCIFRWRLRGVENRHERPASLTICRKDA
jgi:hypothetical protein